MRAALALGLVAACSSPPLQIVLEIADGSQRTCPEPATTCEDIRLGCDPYLSIRVVDPNDPKVPFYKLCKPLPLDRMKDLCSISGIDFGSGVRVPAQTLEVQLVVYAHDELDDDPDNPGDKLCPTDITFSDATGVPVEGIIPPPEGPQHRPSIGGRAFYHEGDTQTVIRLGCTDLTLVDSSSCSGTVITTITATAADFDTQVSVSTTTADRLTLRAGEPKAVIVGTDTTYQLTPADTAPLDRVVFGPPPSWRGDIDLPFTNTACLEILEDGVSTTPTVTCRPYAPNQTLDIPGQWLSKPSLARILQTLGLTQVPDAGLVIGIAVDENLAPAPGVIVSPDLSSTVVFLSPNRDAIVPGTKTSSGGVWVSLDAPYGTSFSGMDGSPEGVYPAVVGGLVSGKITIVVLQKHQANS